MSSLWKKSPVVSAVVLLGLVACGVTLFQTRHLYDIRGLAETNPLIVISLLVFFKTLGILFPPIPGGLVTLGAVPFIGWQYAFISDLAGSLFGSTIAYYIGKRYGFSIIERIFGEKIGSKIRKIKVRPNRQTELIITLRIFTGSILFEAISYSAGIIGIGYRSFIVGTFISQTLVGMPVFIFINHVALTPQNIAVNILLMLVSLAVIFKFKGRYLEQ